MGSIANAPVDLELDEPTVDERRALIERIAGSAHFSRSARLRDFLLYVGHQSLKDGRQEIHEQEIGAKVFGRPSSYDRSQDNIVRVNATELRKRIELYFATEGAHETLLVEIPRGGYKPIFHRRLAEPVKELILDATPDPIEVLQRAPAVLESVSVVRRGLSPRMHLAWAATSIALGVVCLLLWQQNRAMHKLLDPWAGKPAIATFWGDFLRFHQQTDIVLPDDSFSVMEDITHRQFSLNDYLSHDHLRQIQSSDLSADRKVDLDNIGQHNLVTFGGVRAAQLVQPLIPVSSSQNVLFSRYYLADSIKHNNIILIGGKKANPWVHLFDQEANFITDNDEQHKHGFVRNLQPRPGEQALYTAPNDPDAFVGYASVAYLPNPSHTGNAIILAGTDSDATDAAAEFLASDAQLEKFRNLLHVQQFPYFEVVLKISRLSGTSLSAQLVTYRTYPQLH